MKAWHRHLLTLVLLGVLVWLFTLGRAGLHRVHLWNRIFADAAFVLLCLALIIGPVVRFVPRLSPLLPWRRELGIWCTVAALLHVAIYAEGAYDWNVLRFFVRTRGRETVVLKNALAMGNWIGAAAILYAVVLALTSNDFSQRLLRAGPWKLLQQQTYTLFVLTLLHTGIFLYAVMQTRRGIFPYVFWIGAALTAGMQVAGYIQTVRNSRRGISA